MLSTSAGCPPPPKDAGPRVALHLALAVAIVGLGFAFFANEAWEDYYITLRPARNLVEGHGLVYQPGERVQTYTSPLGTLLPAAGLWITGSDIGALWILRVLSVAALAGAAVLLTRSSGLHGAALGAMLMLSVLDAKTLSFATNGMETGIWVFFAALTWRLLIAPAGGIVWLAVGFSGLMWSRPDGMIPAIAMIAGTWLFSVRHDPAPQRQAWWRRVIVAAMLGAALYGPWVIWAWSYYGSPIPNTIMAKSAIAPAGFSWSGIVLAPLRCIIQPTAFDGLFMPITVVPGDWPEPLLLIWRLLARVAGFAWLVPGVSRNARAASFAALLGGVYLQQIANFSWYFGPWTMLGGVALGGLVQALASAVRTAPLARIAAASVIVLSIGLTLATAQTARVYSRLQGPRPLGLWLRANARPGDTVFLEPLGYIGYFSGLKMLDFPGLSAPEVTQLIRDGKRSFADLIPALRPDWIVLRPTELVGYRLKESGALRDYTFVRALDLLPELDQVKFLPHRRAVEFGAVFLLYRRTDSAAPSAPDGRPAPQR